MARESFCNPSVAVVMNEHFINIKVDRDERPDLDKVYQSALQLIVPKSGGWPLTVFLEPDSQLPFFGGSYFPQQARQQMPGFQDLLLRIIDSFDNKREELDEQSQKLVSLVAELTGDDYEEILRKLANGEPVEANPYPDVLAIKDGSEVTRVNVQDIQWIDAAGDYMCVHALDGMHIMRKTMKELEQELNPQFFVRVHRSAIANIRFVKKLVSHISGEYHLILQNETELKVSRSHRDKVKAAMKM